MSQYIKQFIAIIITILCIVGLLLAILGIWDMINIDTTKTIMIKLSYTALAVLLASIVILAVSHMTKHNSSK